MSTPRPYRRSDSDLVFIGVLWLGAFALLATGMLWAAAALVAVVTGNIVATPLELLTAARLEIRNPIGALEPSPGPAPAIYTIWVIALLTLTTTGLWLRDRHQTNAHARRTGKATKKDLAPMHRKNAEKNAQTALKRVLAGASATTAPSSTDDAGETSTRQNVDLVIPFGRYHGAELHLQHEDSVCIIAPARSGKTNYVGIPLILDAPGPVVVTGTKNDVVLLTAVARQRRGDVVAFDPMNIANWPHTPKWDPIAGCEDPEEALDRAKAWAAGASKGGAGAGNAAWFQERAAEVLAYYMHAAAVKDGGNLRDVVAWAGDFSKPEPFNLLDTSPVVKNAGWSDQLRSRIQSGAPETIGSLQMTLSGLLAPLASPRTLEQLCPPVGDRFDITTFLSGANTLYLLTGKGGLTVAPLLTMFTDYIVRSAQNLSQTRPGERLWPSLRLVLDEAANVAAIPSLPEVMSDSGGRGITTIVMCQSFAQMDLRWGREEAESIRANATATLYLPGIKEQDRLENLSNAMGRYRRSSRSYGSEGTYNTSQEWDQTMPADQIRMMKIGTGLLFYRGLKGAQITLTPFWDRPDAKQIMTDQAEAERLTRRRLEPVRDEPHPADVATQDGLAA